MGRKPRREGEAGGAIQSWAQPRLSAVKFDIAPKGAWTEADGTFDATRLRRSDIYVFCVLGGDDVVPDPLNLDEWCFYVLSRRMLDERIPEQRSIVLSSHLRFDPIRATFEDLREPVLAACDSYASHRLWR